MIRSMGTFTAILPTEKSVYVRILLKPVWNVKFYCQNIYPENTGFIYSSQNLCSTI